MIGPYPSLDKRRTDELYQELVAIAAAMLPNWNKARDEAEFAIALMQIAARLGEQVTTRLQRTPQRDAMSFFDLLDIPVQPPRPATAPVVIQLADKHETSVFADARVQIGAATDDDELIFETQEALNLTPARIKLLAAVDAVEDRITTAPEGFLLLEPRETNLPDYRAASFASEGSNLIQIEPAVGLEENDQIRIDGITYRVAGENEGLYELIDKLEADVPELQAIEKLQDFLAFETRNLQKHEVYIGHEDFFNLEEASTITLKFDPAAVATALADGVSWSMYGINEDKGKEEPEWEPLIVEPSGLGLIVLRKDWRGKVEPLEVSGQSSRWLRIRYDQPIQTEVVPNTRVKNVQLKVSTATEDKKDAAEEALRAACLAEKEAPRAATQAAVADGAAPAVGSEAEPVLQEGSSTIDRAFHNGSPLPLTSRFYPFGPEPQRFDTFSIAAPEAFSKPGATVTLDLTTTDASILAMQVTVGPDTPRRAYGVAHNGALQLLILKGGSVQWRELDHPLVSDLSDAGSATSADLELSATLHPQSIQLPKNGEIVTDIVFARDRRGTLWARQVRINTANTEDVDIDEPWNEIPPPSNDPTIADLAVVRRDVGEKSFLFSISGTSLYALDVNRLQASRDNWIPVTSTHPNPPVLGPNSRLVLQQPADWPDPAYGSGPVKLVVIDHVTDDGPPKSPAIWTADVAVDLAASTADATWDPKYEPFVNDENDPRIEATVMPAAAIDGNGSLSIYAAMRVSEELVIPFVWYDGNDVFDPLDPTDPVKLHPGSSFQAFPAGLGSESLGIIQGVNDAGIAFSLWSSGGEHEVISAPGSLTRSDVPSAFAIELDDVPTLVVNAGIEQLFFHDLPVPAINPQLHHALEPSATLPSDAFVEPATAGGVKKLVLLGQRVISTPQNIYPVATFDIDNAGITAIDGDWHIWVPDGTPRNGIVAVADDGAGGSSFELDSGDTTATIGQFLMIGTKPYTITALAGTSPEIVSLSDPLPFADNDSESYDHMSKVETIPVNLLTLLSFERPPGQTVEPTRLRFHAATGAEPAARRPEGIGNMFGNTWTWFETAWQTVPTSASSITVATSTTGEWTSMSFPRGYQNPELAWEYLTGDQWRRIEKKYFDDSTDHLAKSGAITFTVPTDLAPGEVAGQEDYWIRARLIGGDYGRPEYRVVIDNPNSNTQTQTITVDTSNLRPPEIIRIDASFSIDEFVDADHLLVRNNLDLRNQTQANKETDARYDLFVGAARLNRRDVEKSLAPALVPEPEAPDACSVERDDDFLACTKPGDGCSFCEDEPDPCADTETGADTAANASARAIYFGFDRQLDVSRLSFFVDALDQSGSVELEFDVQTRRGWKRVSASDETHGFYRRGFVTVGVDFEPGQTSQLGDTLYWLRAVPVDGGEAWAPVIRQVFVNAASSTQARTVLQEIVGSGTGEHGQRFTLANQPVLPDKLQLRVRESLNEEEIEELNEAAELRGATLRPVEQYEERSIDGDWVLWERVDSFSGLGPDERVYKLDPVKGEIIFGERTKAPPGGANNIRAISYQSGGGSVGNVDAFAIAAIKSPVEAVDKVANPVPASGGSDQPGLDAQIVGAPARLQRAGHALMPPDIEAVCVSFSPDIVRARCLRAANGSGAIRVAVVARTGERCPQLTRALQDGLRASIRDSAWGGLTDEDIHVETPDLVRVRVRVRLLASDPSQAAALEQRAQAALRELTHPVDGGPAGSGWPFGRPIWKSDVLRVLAPLPGFDRVTALRLDPVDDGNDLEALGPMQLVCAEDDDIVVQIAPGGDT